MTEPTPEPLPDDVEVGEVTTIPAPPPEEEA